MTGDAPGPLPDGDGGDAIGSGLRSELGSGLGPRTLELESLGSARPPAMRVHLDVEALRRGLKRRRAAAEAQRAQRGGAGGYTAASLQADPKTLNPKS